MVPVFRVSSDIGETFDAMAEEIIDYRLARHLFTKDRRSQLEQAFRLKVIQAAGRPIIMLDRERNPELPVGETQFIAGGEVYTGNLVKIALNTRRWQMRAAPPPGHTSARPAAQIS